MRSSTSSVPTDKGEGSGHRRLNALSRPLPRVATRPNADTVKLLMLGYKQELAREFTLFNSFGSSVTALSSLTALGGTYNIGIIYGGPVVMLWGWLVVTLFTASVGLSMAELASAYPTSGALYYWSYRLAPPRLRNLACWMTAWILTLGQAGFTASLMYTFAHFVASAVEVHYGIRLTSAEVFMILLVATALIGLLNCGTARLTAFMTTLGTMWHLVALAALCVCLPLIAPARQPAKYIFTSWQPHHEITGIESPVYTTLVGLLMAQWTLTGYDGSAHLAEETFHAEVNVPRAILLAIGGVGFTGFSFLLALTSVKFDVRSLLDPDNETHGENVVLQILIEVCRTPHGSTGNSVMLFTVFIVGAFFCCCQSVANNSRMLYAFARDNGVPLADYAKRVHPRTKAPVYGVLYMLILTTLLSTPMCFNNYVFPAVTSFAVVGMYMAYSLPVLCKLSTGRRFFIPGPFFLGHRLSYINNVITSLWVLTVTVLFTLPQYYPITIVNLNWSAPILGVAFIFSLGWYYFPKYGAYTWFIGPRANLGQFQDVLPSERARKAAEMEAAEAAAAVAAGNAARAAAEATDLLTRMASGTAGGCRSSHYSEQSSRRSIAAFARSLAASPAVTGTGALPSDPTSVAMAVAMVLGASSPRGGEIGPKVTLGRRTLSKGSRGAREGGTAAAAYAASHHLGVSCDGRMSADADGRAAKVRAARRMLSRRHQSMNHIDPWVGPVAPIACQERTSGYSNQRVMQLARVMASSAMGAPIAPPLGASLHDVAEDTEVQEHSSDNTFHARARLRRASVSVMTLPGRPGGQRGAETSDAGAGPAGNMAVEGDAGSSSRAMPEVDMHATIQLGRRTGECHAVAGGFVGCPQPLMSDDGRGMVQASVDQAVREHCVRRVSVYGRLASGHRAESHSGIGAAREPVAEEAEAAADADGRAAGGGCGGGVRSE